MKRRWKVLLEAIRNEVKATDVLPTHAAQVKRNSLPHMASVDKRLQSNRQERFVACQYLIGALSVEHDFDTGLAYLAEDTVLGVYARAAEGFVLSADQRVKIVNQFVRTNVDLVKLGA